MVYLTLMPKRVNFIRNKSIAGPTVVPPNALNINSLAPININC